ncbi:MAG: CoA transferase [Pseudomonadota bacterium]
MSSKPLTGLRVLDLTNVLAGPFCGHQLAHLGAEVIKVETVGRGDLARQLGASEALNERLMGISFLAQNAGKKSITLNLKSDKGVAIFKRLAATADILIENFRPGVMARLQCDYEALRAIKPDLIYCAISGFGQTGPWVDRPAYDQIIQGASGVMSITGDSETAPLRVGYPISDTIGGLTAAMAITAALNAPHRGTFIDVSMLEATIATMGWVVSNYLIGEVIPAPLGNENMTAAPSGTFQAADGPINIAANKHEQWDALARHLGRADLIDDKRFAGRDDRKRNRQALTREIEAALAAKTAAVWADELTAIGVPAGAILTVPEVLAHAQTRDRGLTTEFTDVPGVDGPVRVVRPGVMFNGEPPTVSEPPPELGADTADILGALGVSETELAQLKDEGVI